MEKTQSLSVPSPCSNRALLLPFLLPYLAYVAPGPLGLQPEWAYGVRLVVVPVLLWWAWRWFPPLRGPRTAAGSVLIGAAAGLFGLLLWIGLVSPLVEEGNAWGGTAFGLRLLASGLLVPIFEEMLMRGYFLRLALQWDEARRQGEKHALEVALDERSIMDVQPGAWSWRALALSTAAFTAGHQVVEWPAAVVYGLLMAGLWIVRRDLLSCVVAHAVTNVALAVYVRTTGSWGLW
jgi:uncharacterized protein